MYKVLEKKENITSFDVKSGVYATLDYIDFGFKKEYYKNIEFIYSFEDYIISIDIENVMCVWNNAKIIKTYKNIYYEYAFKLEGFHLSSYEVNDDETYYNIIDIKNDKKILKEDILNYDLDYFNDGRNEIIIGHQIGISNKIIRLDRKSKILWCNDLSDFLTDEDDYTFDIFDFIGIINNNIWFNSEDRVVILDYKTGNIIKVFCDNDFICDDDFFKKYNFEIIDDLNNYSVLTFNHKYICYGNNTKIFKINSTTLEVTQPVKYSEENLNDTDPQIHDNNLLTYFRRNEKKMHEHYLVIYDYEKRKLKNAIPSLGFNCIIKDDKLYVFILKYSENIMDLYDLHIYKLITKKRWEFWK